MTLDKFTNQEIFVNVGNGHELYVHDWGNSKAKTPIIFLHGGPGGSTKDTHKKSFDPNVERVIFFDQRGSGKSLPSGSLENNTTDDSISDIETITNLLKIEKIIITGGSWGACLALAYAIKHPKKVSALVLNGIFTGRKSEIEYVDRGGFRTYFPDIWEKYVQTVPEKYRNDPSRYHYKNVFGGDDILAKKSTYAFSEMLEGPLLSLDDRYVPDDYDEFDLNPMKIELHYLKNGCFMPEGYIMKNADKLKMPIWLVQGRYDMVYPAITAYELDKKLPNSKLVWTTSGHKAEREAWNVMRNILIQLSC